MMLITSMLGAYFTFAHLKNLDNLLQEHGIAISRQLISSADYALTINEATSFQQLAQAALEERDVRAFILYDENKNTLIHFGPTMWPQNESTKTGLGNETNLVNTEQSLRIIAPISPAAIHSNNKQPNATKNNNSLQPPVNGWIEIELSTTNTTLKKYQSLMSGGLIVFLSLLMEVLLVLKLSNDVTQPIQEIADAVNRIKEGKLRVIVNTGAGGELHTLEQSINEMSFALSKDQQEMQQSINQATEDLRETLETIEIQNIELDMARKEALEASRIKSEFLANMSHEIRTPLNGIIGFANLLMKTPLQARQLDYLETIEKSSEGLMAIINDILDFSKIEAGKLVLDSIPMDIREAVDDVVTMLAPPAYDKGLEVTPITFSDVPQQLMGDPLRIKQVITNLVSNAIKFTNHGGITLSISIKDEVDQAIILKISITDTGVGLSPRQQKELFKAFTQADTSSTRKSGGTGLGLVISKKLVEQMGGDIGLRSEVGKGSTFWFTTKLQITPQAFGNEDDTPFIHRKVAYFDTHQPSRQALGQILDTWKIESESFSSLEQLLKRENDTTNSNNPFDILIIDLDSQTLKRDQQIEKLVTLHQSITDKIILLHNPMDAAEVEKSKGSMSYTLIAKPLNTKKLRNGIHTIIFGENFSDIEDFLSTSNTNTFDMPHILAVDDNPSNLKLVKTLLEDLKAKVTTAKSGVEAITQISHHKFDMVFMDVQMPGMDGIETTRRIRAGENRGEHTPVVALTAHALAGEKEQLLIAGIDDYITKPINEEQLRHIVLKWTGSNLKPTISPNSQSITTHSIHNSVSPAVDMTLGLKLANGKSDLAWEMINMLLATLTDDKIWINNGYSSGNHEALLERVHKLHGATKYCGTPKLKAAAELTETFIKKQMFDKLPQGIQYLNEEIDAVLAWSETNNPAVITQKET